VLRFTRRPPTPRVPSGAAALHAAACLRHELHCPPEDPRVFSAAGHRRRGRCCGAHCRHCPFERVAGVPLVSHDLLTLYRGQPAGARRLSADYVARFERGELYGPVAVRAVVA
jgi:hypothetical protein